MIELVAELAGVDELREAHLARLPYAAALMAAVPETLRPGVMWAKCARCAEGFEADVHAGDRKLYCGATCARLAANERRKRRAIESARVP